MSKTSKAQVVSRRKALARLGLGAAVGLYGASAAASRRQRHGEDQAFPLR